MKVNVTIEVKDDLLDYLTKIVGDNEPGGEKEVIKFLTEIIWDDYREFYFVKKEIFEEVLRRLKKIWSLV